MILLLLSSKLQGFFPPVNLWIEKRLGAGNHRGDETNEKWNTVEGERGSMNISKEKSEILYTLQRYGDDCHLFCCSLHSGIRCIQNQLNVFNFPCKWKQGIKSDATLDTNCTIQTKAFQFVQFARWAGEMELCIHRP